MRKLALFLAASVAIGMVVAACGSDKHSRLRPSFGEDFAAISQVVAPPKPGAPLPPPVGDAFDEQDLLEDSSVQVGAPLPPPVANRPIRNPVADVPPPSPRPMPCGKVQEAPAPTVVVLVAPEPVMAPAAPAAPATSPETTPVGCRMTRDLGAVAEDVNQMSGNFAQCDARLSAIEARLSAVETSVAELGAQVSKLEATPAPTVPVVRTCASAQGETTVGGLIRNWRAGSAVADSYLRKLCRDNPGMTRTGLLALLRTECDDQALTAWVADRVGD